MNKTFDNSIDGFTLVHISRNPWENSDEARWLGANTPHLKYIQNLI